MLNIWVQRDKNKNITSWADSEIENYEKVEISEEDFMNFNDTEGRAFEIIDGIAVKTKDIEQEKEKLSDRYNNIIRISKHKEQLASTDYKIIKCAEAQILDKEMPYDVESLVFERQKLRNSINELDD